MEVICSEKNNQVPVPDTNIEVSNPKLEVNSISEAMKSEASNSSECAKIGAGSEYESAEEDRGKHTDKNCEELPSKDQESLSELVDEEGGEEDIAEPEDIEGEFLEDQHHNENDEYVEEQSNFSNAVKTDDKTPSKAAPEKVASTIERNEVSDKKDGKPVEHEEPVDSSAKCIEGDEKPVDKDAEPAKEDAEPVEEDAEPVEEDAEPVEEDAEPVEEYAEPVEEDAEPVGKDAEFVEADAELDDEELEEGVVEADDDFEGDEIDEGSEGEYADERQQEDEGSEGEYVEEERQQGDGEECSPVNTVMEKELDFDEDRRNPQYIPKKGIFYEHDDRNNEDVKEKEEEPTRDKKKKLWLDEGRWGHDRFRLEEQFPKSKHELIETYGYDIRNEDGPPRARRRRRYGRGPTKYERNWEDVTAYGREKSRGTQRGVSRGRRPSGRFRGGPGFRGRGRKEFISNDSSNTDYENENAKDEEGSVENESQEVALKDTVPVINSNEFPALPSKSSIIESESTFEKRPFFQKSSSEAPENKSVRTLTFENSNLSGRNSLERDVPLLKSKPMVYGRQQEKNMHHSDRNINQHDRNMYQNDRNINQHDRNMHHQNDRSVNQYERNMHQNERSVNQHERSVNQHERSVNQHERSMHQNERSINQHERNTNLYEKNINQYEKNGSPPERNISYHEKNIPHHDRNMSHHDRSTSYHERGTRKPVSSRGGRGSGRDRRGRGGGMRHISPRFLENKVNNLNADLEQLNIEDAAADMCNGLTTDKIQQLDHDIVPNISSESEITNVSVKGAGDSSSRPKRYSSLRQRSLPETASYQPSQPAVPTQPSPYYETAGYQPTLYAPTNTGVPTPSTQSQSATSPPLMNPSGFHPYDCGLRVQVFPRAIFPQPTMPTGQSVLAPPPPSSCIPPPNPNLIDFAAPPPPPSGYHQYAYQQYAQPAAPPPPTAAPNDIYQPGITYYFAQQTQTTSTRPTVQKRPKAAIPILPPPDREMKKNENKEGPHASNSRKSSNDTVNGEMPSLRTDTSSQSKQIQSVGVES